MVDADLVKPDGHSDLRFKIADGKDLSIVIMDSGMGGLSICADIVKGLQAQPIANRVSITYFNAWPEQHRGYNSLPDISERLRVFDRALLGMQAFAPDIVYIACNTLSILYPQTEFSRFAPVPVIGIIEFGVDLIHAHLGPHEKSQVILLGTLTTIASQAHKRALMARGIDERRVVSQACDQLATEIEKDPDGPKVSAMIDACIRQTAANLADPPAPVFAALCCTHYGYAAGAFRQSLDTHVSPAASILNPNESMSAHFCKCFAGRPSHRADIDLAVVSRITWSDQKVAAIAKALQSASPETAQALKNYRHDSKLFSF